MKTMRALAKRKPERGIWMDAVPIPDIGPNDVLVKIKKTAICGTDIHIHNWDEWSQNTIPVPMTIGHEFAGVIEALGSEVVGLKEGDRVSGEGHLTCGHCRNCRAGNDTFAAIPLGSGSTAPVVSPSFSVSRRSMSFRCRTTSTTRSAPCWILWEMPPTPPSPTTWWVRTS